MLQDFGLLKALRSKMNKKMGLRAYGEYDEVEKDY